MSGKYKGTDRNVARTGLNRLRRAHAKSTARTSGWERLADDEAGMEQHVHLGKVSHYAENVLARFNRLAVPSDTIDPEALAIISGFQGNQVLIRSNDASEHTCTLRRTLLKRIGGVRNPLAVGDRVLWSRSDQQITDIAPRRSALARADSHNKALVHVLCANLDALLVTASLTQPAFKPGFIDRALILAAASGIDAAVVLTKSDLCPPFAADLYRALGLPVFVISADDDRDLEAVRSYVRTRTVAITGQSGVGKSTLVNRCFGLSLRTAVVDDDGLGRHTTTSARWLAVPGGGAIIDTPGIRECAVHGLSAMDVSLLMPDLAALQPHCHFGDCTHGHEPGCAVIAALNDNRLAATRYDSYRSMITDDLAHSL